MLKTLIVLLMIALVASLASGLVFLMSDRGNPNKKRLFTSLGVRLGLGACLLLVILFRRHNRPARPTKPVGPRPKRYRTNRNTRLGPLSLVEREVANKKGRQSALVAALRRSQDVNKQKQKHPHHIDKMPIPA